MRGFVELIWIIYLVLNMHEGVLNWNDIEGFFTALISRGDFLECFFEAALGPISA